MLSVLILSAVTIFVNGLTCPPSCEPPDTESGCKGYTKNAVCSQDVKDISSSEAHCGCLWQTYIQTVEPEAKIIFTDEGNQCYTWAAKLCSILEESEKSLLSARRKLGLNIFREGTDLEDIQRHFQKLGLMQVEAGHRTEKAKHRRRNGVGTLSKDLENLLNKGYLDKAREINVRKQEVCHDITKYQQPTESSYTPGCKMDFSSTVENIGQPRLVCKNIELKKQDIIDAQKDASKQKSRELREMTVKGMHMDSNKMQNNIEEVHRNNNDINGEFIGKPGQSRSASWVEVVPEREIPMRPTEIPAVTSGPPKVKPAATVKDSYTVRRHWIDVDMPVDQFKLGVFMIILLLNILVVVFLIVCRKSGGNKKQASTRPAGDLDESVYYPDSPGGTSERRRHKKRKSPISNFIDSFRKKTPRDSNRSNASNKYLQMMEVNPDEFISNRNAYSKVRKDSPFIDARMYRSPKKISRGLYENIDEEPDDVLDHSYEEPLPPLMSHSDSREFYKRKYRSDSFSEDSSSPTKYFPRDPDASDGDTNIESQETS